MMNEKQREQAERVLMGLSNEDSKKYYAFKRHERACYLWKRYGIPYRCAYDYLKKDLQGVVPINDCYPLPGYPRDIKKIILHAPEDTLPNELIPNEEKQAEIQAYADRLFTWGAFDSEEWKYRVLHLFPGYDFASFTAFDFTGENQELCYGDLELLRKVYKRLQDEYEFDPQKYLTDEPKYKAEYNEQYTDNLYELVLDNEAEQERKELQKRIGIGD